MDEKQLPAPEDVDGTLDARRQCPLLFFFFFVGGVGGRLGGGGAVGGGGACIQRTSEGARWMLPTSSKLQMEFRMQKVHAIAELLLQIYVSKYKARGTLRTRAPMSHSFLEPQMQVSVFFC